MKEELKQFSLTSTNTIGDTAHVHTIVQFLPHSHQHGPVDRVYRCDDRLLYNCDTTHDIGRTNTLSLM